MGRDSRVKLDERAKIPVQIISQNSIEECAVTVDGTSIVRVEKRKEEAEKPLYLRRI